MLYVFLGDDQVVVRSHAHDFIFDRESEGATVMRYEPSTYEQGMVASLVGSVSLFGGTRIIVLDSFSEHAEAAEELIASLDALAQSSDTFVVIDGLFSSAHEKEIKKYAEDFFEARAKDQRFNTFALADALANRDKKTLWLLLIRSRIAEVSPEEVAGTLWWKLKSLRLAKLTETASEAGMKDFPYTKAKRASAKFTTEELQNLSLSLITLYHKGHLGETDLDLALERWVLTV